MNQTAAKGQRVQSVERALDILEYVSQRSQGAGLNDLSERLAVSPAAAFNLAETLTSRRYLKRTERPVRYQIGIKLFEIAQTIGDRPLLDRIGEALKSLSTEWPGVNLVAATAAGTDMLLRLRMDPTRPGVLQRPLQPATHPYSLATTLCLLAFLPREQFSLILQRYPLEEFGPREMSSRSVLEKYLAAIRKAGGVVTMAGRPRVAFPIMDRDLQVVAAIGASMSDEKPPCQTTFHALECAIRTAATGLSAGEIPHLQSSTSTHNH